MSAGCCCVGPAQTCCQPGAGADRKVDIEFLYLDLESCNWCQETEANLEAAITQVEPVLASLGVQLSLVKRQVRSEREARALGMSASPSIRVNGQDIQPEVELAYCGPCSELCGEDTECRVWSYQGQSYTAPPIPLLVEAILRAAVAQ